LKQYTKIQASLSPESNGDAELIAHFKAVREAYGHFNSDADALRQILFRDMHVSKTHGLTWDWRNIAKTPPYVEKILSAIKAMGSNAKVIVEESASGNRVEFGDGLFDE